MGSRFMRKQLLTVLKGLSPPAGAQVNSVVGSTAAVGCRLPDRPLAVATIHWPLCGSWQSSQLPHWGKYAIQR